MKRKCIVYLSLLLSILCIQCSDENLEVSFNLETKEITENEIVLGKKQDNPYTLDNMQKAMDLLGEEGLLKSKTITGYLLRAS